MPLDACLATFALDTDAVGRRAASGDSLAIMLKRTGWPALAVELVRDRRRHRDGPSLALLISAADDAHTPQRLSCLLGFANDPAWCDRGRAAGLPMVEAAIRLPNRCAGVRAAAYAETPPGAAATLHVEAFVAIAGLSLAEPGAADTRAVDSALRRVWRPVYEQVIEAPDGAEPASRLQQLSVAWAPDRVIAYGGTDPPPRCRIVFKALRYPNFAGLLKPTAGARRAPQALACIRSTIAAWPAQRVIQQAAAGRTPARVPSSTVFGRQHFRFDTVEIIGFRLDLGRLGVADADPALRAWIRRLNFHLDPRHDPRGAGADFEYRPASDTVIIELLRYGAMRSLDPLPPLLPHDFMQQHELLARVLVGRVDDDGAQARDAAGYVPAIFVDNPWSRAVGRALEGFPKQLAAFIGSGGQVLGMNGCAPPLRGGNLAEAAPLVDVNRIARVEREGSRPRPRDTVLELDYGGADFDAPFLPVDLRFALAGLPQGPWRQADFDDRAFRRSFARDVHRRGYSRFGGIQFTPLDGQPLARAWVGSSFSLSQLETQFPAGLARLTLRSRGLGRNHPWSQLCRLLGARGGEPASVAVASGDWYRLRCAMDFRVEEPLRC